jgi:hypothetical protein
MSTITITDVGPIASLSIDVPSGGGVVEFLGPHGVGKSHALAAIDAAVSGNGKPPVRDAAVSGEVNALGATLRIGKRVTRDVEGLEVTSIDGRFSVADLIDPALKDPAAADSKRIKALLQITGETPSAELFYPLFGGKAEFEAAVKSTTLECDDLVRMAEGVKRDCEARARDAADEAIKAEGRAKALLQSVDGIDLHAEADGAKLQGELEAAIRGEQALQTKARAANQARLQADLAKDRLEEIAATYAGPTVEDAAAELARTKGEVERVNAEVVKAEEALNAARRMQVTANNAHAIAIREHKTAVHHAETLAATQQALGAVIPEAPAPEQLAAAAEKVAKARVAQEAGTLIRKALADQAKAEAAIRDASAFRVREKGLRAAAAGVEKVLSEAVSRVGGPLQVHAGRLVLPTDRGLEAFGDLSEGERCALSVEIAAKAVARLAQQHGTERGIVVLPQRFWQELNRHSRGRIHEIAKEHKATVFTGRITDEGELEAREWEPETA